MKWIVLLICSGLCGLLYHMGGLGTDYSKAVIYNRWVRRIGCPICVTIATAFFIPWSNYKIVYSLGALTLQFGLLLAGLTTYYKALFGDKHFWLNWTFGGGASAASALPMAFCGISIWLILARVIVLAVAWGVATRIFQSPRWSECSRGFMLTFSTLIFGVGI